MENRMQTNRWSRRSVLTTTLTLGAAALMPRAFAQGGPVLDRDYKLITPAQSPSTGGKVEVIEFFSYACPHCAEFEAPLQGWLRKKPSDVSFRAVPVIFRESWAPLAKLYFALETMGHLGKVHGKVFHAMHGSEAIDLSDPDKLFPWIAKQGVDQAKFKEIYNSFGMDAKISGYKKAAIDHQVKFTPVVAINGKYLTGPSMVREQGRFFQVVDALIAQERAKLAKPAPKPK